MANKTQTKFLQIAESVIADLQELPLGAKVYSVSEIQKRYETTIGTASRVLNELQLRGYIRSEPLVGSVLISKKEKQFILCLLPENMDDIPYHWLELLTRLSLACGQEYGHYTLLMVTSEHLLYEIKNLKNSFKKICGVIFFRAIINEFDNIAKLKELKIPFVFYGSSLHEGLLEEDSCLLNDEQQIMNLIVEHLEEKGHKEVGYIYNKLNRLDLLRRSYLPTKDFHLYDDLISPMNEWLDDLLTNPEKLEKFHDFLKSITALIIAHDDHVVTILTAINMLGIKVPEDVSIISIDNLPVSQQLYPPLTTVSLNVFENAIKCIEILDQINEKGVENSRIMLKSDLTLVERKSVKSLK